MLPVVFDFSIPASRDVTETVKVLAGLARFVIADITDATGGPRRVARYCAVFPSLAVQPILLRGQTEFFSLQRDQQPFPWVLPIFEYDTRSNCWPAWTSA